jgi:hypothetical protein
MKSFVTITMIAAFAAPTSAHADAQSDATALFEQGIKDMQAGNIEQACRLLAASLAKYPDSGTKGALAECYTTLGKVASAWTLFKELEVTAPSDDLKADAAAQATKLEARMPRYQLKLVEATPGLTVKINGTDVADPTLAVALPVDPGPLLVIASAAGYKSWNGKATAYEGRTTTIEIPKLVEAPKPVEPKVTPGGPQGPTTLVVREDNSGTRRSRHVIGGSMMIVGAISLGVGGYFGSQAFKQWDEAKLVCGGEDRIDTCQDPAQGQFFADQARNKALTSTILMGAGGAVLVVGAIVWLSAPKDERKTATAIRVVPSVGTEGFGVTLTGGFR